MPGDVAVVSFDDDSDLAVWLRPALSSVAPPHRELATAAVALALGPDDPAGGRRRLEMPLRLHESVGPPSPVR